MLIFPPSDPPIPVAALPHAISPCSMKNWIWVSRAQAKEASPSHFKLAVLSGILWDPPSFVMPQPLDTLNYHQNKMTALAKHLKGPGFVGRDDRSGRACRDANTKASPAASTAAFPLPLPSIVKPPHGKMKIIQSQNGLGWKGPSKIAQSNLLAMDKDIFH